MSARVALRLGLALCGAAMGLDAAQAFASWRTIGPGIEYRRTSTAGQEIHVARIDLRRPGVSVRTTRRSDWYQTTSAFGRRYGASVAINGDFFTARTVSGLAIAGGVRLHGDTRRETFVAFGANHRVLMQERAAEVLRDAAVPSWVREAVGGQPTVLWKGVQVPCALRFCQQRHPRTAVGLSAERRFLLLVVVDGRRAGAAGMTIAELGGYLASLGARWAVNLDGGGSSTMWVEDRVVNQPSDGRERVVANHLGVIGNSSKKWIQLK